MADLPQAPKYSEMLGWQGEELPIGAQAAVVLKKFYPAITVWKANAELLHDELTLLLQGCPLEEVSQRLGTNPFFMVVMDRLATLPERSAFKDETFRKNAQDLYEGVRRGNADVIIDLCAAMWVTDGSDISQELIDLCRVAEEESDEEEAPITETTTQETPDGTVQE